MPRDLVEAFGTPAKTKSLTSETEPLRVAAPAAFDLGRSNDKCLGTSG